MTLDALHDLFRAWFSQEYDVAAIDVVLATKAAEQLDGDPLWTLLITGSGNAKTETVNSLSDLPDVIITSTITSDGALLSASPKRETAKDATGGLLRRLGSRGALVIKDVTSILSMNANTRAAVLAALREIHDGRWERNVGTDGGRSLTWHGRIAVIGACTTAWDRAHDVVAAMGDRFVILRMDSTKGRLAAGYKSMANIGDEVRMREALAGAVAAILATVKKHHVIHPTLDETTQLLQAADVVTICRTGVDFDYRGAVIDCHAPEMPTRFAKQLLQVLRGACAIGMPRNQALNLALRCARDSMPPLRLAILEDVAAHPHSRTKDVRQRLNKPYSTIDRQLQALHMLGALACDEVEDASRQRSSWYYDVNPDLDIRAIRVSEILVSKVLGEKEGTAPAITATHFSGTRDRLTAGVVQ
jgi:hypothetical protein